MSPYYAPIVEKLLETTRRPDGNQEGLNRFWFYRAPIQKLNGKHWTKFCFTQKSINPYLKSNLRAAAYEAVMEMIKNSPEDCYPTVLKTTEEIMKCIQGTFTMQISQSERSQFNDLQSLLCATLQVSFGLK